MSWRATLVLVLLVAALISGWAAWQQRASPLVEAEGPMRSDYVLHDFELTALSSEGTEAFTLRAPLLEQHPQDRTIQIDTPLFLLPDGDGGYWEVRSRSAMVTADHDEMHLLGDVLAEGTNNAGQPVTLETQRLNIYPDTRTATSAERVTIEQPGSTIQGRGMEVDLASKRYEFKSEVRSRYVPSHR